MRAFVVTSQNILLQETCTVKWSTNVSSSLNTNYSTDYGCSKFQFCL